MRNFKELVDAMVGVYGVDSYLDNPEDCVESEDDLFFVCPGCDEPVYCGDWDIKDILWKRTFICPICGDKYEL